MADVDLASLVRAGAILSVSAALPEDERTGTISARRYTHPALPGRPLVRLVPDPVAAGIDAEMDVLGFASPDVAGPLGRQRYRALGFPGWALVNDPKRARFALDVMKDFKKAAARAKSKPGHARDAFVEISDRLARAVPHFLPSFWEEAGRVFLAEDAASFAAQAFEKARTAEKEHRLAVDEDLRSAVYLEFALAGAVAAKSFAGYGKELERSFGAAAAYPRFRELAVRRTLGGLPPWAGMAKDLRALAKAAGLDLAAEDARLLSDLLDAPTLLRAPGDFWSTYRPALVALCRKERKARQRVRTLFPRPSSGAQGFVEDWLAVLEESGVVEGLVAGTEGEPPGTAAGFLSALAEFVGDDKRFVGYLDRFAARLLADGVPLALDRKHKWTTVLDLRVVEHALALGLPLADPKSAFHLGADLVDPVRVATDPRFGPRLVEAVAQVVGQASFEAEAKGKAGFAEARAIWLRAQVDRLAQGALPDLGDALEVLERRTGPAIFADNPAEYARLGATSVARALAVSLRGGVLAELTWPAFEAAAAELGPHHVTGAFPYVVLWDARLRAIVVRGADRVLDHSLLLPKGVTAQQALFVDGQLCVFFWDPAVSEQRCYWSADPSHPRPVETMPYHHGTDLLLQAEVVGGGVTLGGRVVRAGDPGFSAASRLAFDGTTYWTQEWHDGRHRLVELDPTTGKTGRPSWPSIARGRSEETDGLRIVDVVVLPCPPGAEATPLGQSGGFVGSVVRSDGRRWELTGIDGRTRTAAHPMEALVQFPGDPRPRSIVGTRRYTRGARNGIDLRDPDGVLLGQLGAAPWDHAPFASIPPPSTWHFLRARDPAGSLALRAVDEALAAELLADRTRADATTAVRARLPAVTDPALIAALAGQLDAAARLSEQLAELHAARAADARRVVDEGELLPQELIAALGPLLSRFWGHEPITPAIRAAASALAFERGKDHPGSSFPWIAFVGRLGGLAFYAQSLTLAPEPRGHLLRFLRAVAAHPSLTGDPAHLRVFRAKLGAGSPLVGGVDAKSVAHVGDANAWFAVTVEQGERLVVERARGAFALPAETTLIDEEPPAADEAALVSAYLAAPPPQRITEEAIALFGQETGLTRAEAAVVLVGVPVVNQWGGDFFGKAAREACGLKVGDAKIARESLRAIQPNTWLRVFAAAARGAELADLDDPVRRARRLAAGWNEVVGRRSALREELVVACEKELDPPVRTTDLLAALSAPETSPLLRVAEPTWEALFAWQPPEDRLSPQSLMACCLLLPWAYATLPAGDPYRDAAPGLHTALLARLADPRLRLPLATVYADGKAVGQNRALFEAIPGAEGTRVVDAQGTTAASREGAGFSAVLQRKDSYLQVLFAPALVSADDPLALRLATASHTAIALTAVRLLRSPGYAAMMARIAGAALPAGRHEGDPSLSAPSLVEEVAAAKGLTKEAAVLYLQVLALAEPTQKNVTAWNQWKPPVYKKAAAELVTARLVVEGKRERAGREIFLPGAWDKGQGKALPMERWKQPLYALDQGTLARTLPLVPLPEIFAAAWARVASGDSPKLEEV